LKNIFKQHIVWFIPHSKHDPSLLHTWIV